MLISELIAKKRDGERLTKEEIEYMIKDYTKGLIPDYQMSAMCMAILFKGMDDDETLHLTQAMKNSGDVIDLRGIKGIKADKHSTGGVGDKTSLVLCPMVAACGVKIAKMSGRGLGFTGGTIDKLESFPGFSTALDVDKFHENVNKLGISIIGQTADLVPADKKLYALRDVTGTVASIPLISSSIMSKKLAAGADIIVLDVKCGDGAFMKSEKEAVLLAKAMTKIGRGAGKKCAAIITDMDQPLGNAVGNALEVKEAISVLKGETSNDLLTVCLALGSAILTLGGLAGNMEDAEKMLRKTIEDGSALDKLADLVEGQGGRRADVYDPSALPAALAVYHVISEESGYVERIKTEKTGLVSLHLGGGRVTKESTIDLSVGLIFSKKVGDRVEKGDVLATIHASSEESAVRAAGELRDCFVFSESPVEKGKTIKQIIM